MTINRTKIPPILVEVSLLNAIARRLRDHGVPEFDTIAAEVMLDLTGKHVVNPPAGVPHMFTIEGVHLIWPQGLDTRVPDKTERDLINRALAAIGNKERMTDEDNVRVFRTCYTALWHRVRIQANERAEQMRLTPEPIAEPTGPIITTSMIEGRNPVLEVTPTGEVKPKAKRTRKPKVESTQTTLDALETDQPGTVEWAYAQTKVEPVVSTIDTLTSLESTLAGLRKTLEGAES